MTLYNDTAEDYLKLIGNWTDPNPTPVITQHEGYHVVRDDMLGFGSKTRAGDYLIGHDPQYQNIQEWVYGSSPATGYAQISIPVICNRYGKKSVIFMAERSIDKLHEYQKRGIELGGVYHWVPNGMLPVTQKRARDYVDESPDTRALLPIGVEHPTSIACLIRVARSLPISPKEVWTVGSSGTLSRALQLAWPEAEVHVVSVGHAMGDREIGRAWYHKSPYKFSSPVKKEHIPPYPSAPTYDAKVWHIMKEWHKTHIPKDPCLVWNVA
jgi:hypothetical protein